jgi:CheY-like chemotaxis protein
LVKKVLVVEDNEMNLDMLSRRLERRGFLVVSAQDGTEALEAARRHRPDLILLDLSLPHLDGWTAARILKSEEQTKSIPIIALTAHALSGDREKAKQSGCDDYDTKPVEIVRLLAKIEQWTKPGTGEVAV